MARLIVLFLLIFGTMTSSVRAKEDLTWFIWDLPPEFIKSGPWANQGYADKFLKHFIDNLPQYEHHIQRVNIPRWGAEVLRPQRCTAHVWGGFFPDQLILSKPYSVTPPHVLIFHKRHQDRIGKPGATVSIQNMLEQDDLRLLTQRIFFTDKKDQSRYPILHPWLAPYIGKHNLVELSGGRNDIDLRLLAKERADYTIGYPTTITTQKRIFGLEDDFVSYNIREHFFFKKVYVACRNTDFGREVIKQVNQLISKDMLRTFLGYHEEWNDKDPFFRRIYSDYFLKGLSPFNVMD